MLQYFEVAGGSIPGRNHVGRGRLLKGRNNQDAFGWFLSREAIAVIVCDGCGSGAYTESGAQIASRLILARLKHYLELERARMGSNKNKGPDFPVLLEAVRGDVLAELRVLISQMGDDPVQTMSDYFMFTVLGAVITPLSTTIFSLGDGIYFVNGRKRCIGPFEGNAPPYLAYGLMASPPPSMAPSAMRFVIQEELATEDLNTLLIGTDGVDDLAERAGHLIPGRSDFVGPVSQFWEEARYVTNPDAIRRRLALINSQAVTASGILETGLLHDDTTLVVVRRRTVPGEGS